MPSKIDIAVSALLREVSAAIVMPRYCNLRDGQISEKSPGEVVTIADHEAEEALREGLMRLEGSARIIGEESAGQHPEILDGLDSGAVWIIDPVDGTKNFASGKGPFGMMIAFVVDGQTQGAWLYCPLTDRMCHAARAEGAWINGTPVRARPSGGDRPVASLATQFMSPDLRQSIHKEVERQFVREPIPGCAAEHYPRVVLGTYDVSLFQRTLPWDHAAGALFLEEAGGRAARWNGDTYRIGDGGFGLLVAANPALWDMAAETLFGPDTGLVASFGGLPL